MMIKRPDLLFFKSAFAFREKMAKLEDASNNKKIRTTVDGSTLLVNEGKEIFTTFPNKKSGLRRCNSIAAPNRKQKSPTTTGDLAKKHHLKRFQQQNPDVIRRTSRVKPPPEEIKRLYEQNFTSTVRNEKIEPKKAWEADTKTESEKSQTTAVNDLDRRLGAYGSASTSSEEKNNQINQQLKDGSDTAPGLKNIILVNGEPMAETEVENQSKEEPSQSQQLEFFSSRSGQENHGRPRSMIVTKNEKITIYENPPSNDLENTLENFAKQERQRVFERTQLRRSYIRLPRNEDDWNRTRSTFLPMNNTASPNEETSFSTSSLERTKQKSSRFTSVSSQSAGVLSTHTDNQSADIYSSDVSRLLEENCKETEVFRNNDIRERIKRYKESTSSLDDSISNEIRKSSTGSSGKAQPTEHFAGMLNVF